MLLCYFAGADLTGYRYLIRSCVSLEDISDEALQQYFASGAGLAANAAGLKQV